MQNLFFFEIMYEYFFASEKIDINNILEYILSNKKFVNYIVRSHQVFRINGFINYLKKKLQIKSYKLILPLHVKNDRNNGGFDKNIEIYYRNIIDGFIFINNGKYMVWDFSLKNRLKQIREGVLKEWKNGL